MNGTFLKSKNLIEPTAVSFNIFKSLNKDLVGVNDILILGAGFIGQIVSRIINTYRKKNNIYITDRNNFKLDTVKKYSFRQIFIPKKDSNIKNVDKQFESKFDIVIETTGKSNSFINALKYAKKDGVVIYSGNINKKLILDIDEVSNILRKQLTIKGVWNSTFKSKIDNWKQAEKFIVQNNHLDQLITHTTDLNNAPSLMEQIHLKKLGKIKNNYLKGLIKSF